MAEEKDWRLLNDVEYLREAEMNPTDGEEITEKATNLNKCIFCWDVVENDGNQIWYIPKDVSCCICEECFNVFKDEFKWKLLDGWDIAW